MFTLTTCRGPSTGTPAPDPPPSSSNPSAGRASPPGTVATSTGEWVLSFDGNQGYDRLVTEVHHRNLEAGFDGGHDTHGTWPGDHDMACNGPTTSRTLHADHPEESFYLCKDHLMTSMGDVDGYSIVAFSPATAFTDLNEVCWDVNLTDLGARKWWQMVVVPEAVFQANGQKLAYINPNFESVDGTASTYSSGVVGVVFQQKLVVFDGREMVLDDWWNPFSTDDKARRYRHCVTDNGDGTLTIAQERDGGLYTEVVDGRLPDGAARVLFVDDTYTPTKDGPVPGFTWHWDNVVVRSGAAAGIGTANFASA